MPIYEFYCEACHRIFSFYSKSVNTTKRPDCPRCRKRKLERNVSLFAMGGKARGESGGEEGPDDFPVDERRMERALESLAGECGNVNEEDPRQAARLMRKLSKTAGLDFNGPMEDAIRRLEAGEDPAAIEADMGDAMETEFPFSVRKGGKGSRSRPPEVDSKLYDL